MCMFICSSRICLKDCPIFQWGHFCTFLKLSRSYLYGSIYVFSILLHYFNMSSLLPILHSLNTPIPWDLKMTRRFPPILFFLKTLLSIMFSLSFYINFIIISSASTKTHTGIIMDIKSNLCVNLEKNQHFIMYYLSTQDCSICFIFLCFLLSALYTFQCKNCI